MREIFVIYKKSISNLTDNTVPSYY